MNELYAEAGVKKKADVKTYLLKTLLIAGVVVLFLAGILFMSTSAGSVLIFVASIGIVAIIYLLPRFNVDYEYIFCDGQFDFDKIMGGQRRKTILKVDLENSEILAPIASHSLDGYTYQKLLVKDFTSGNKEAKVYALVGKAVIGKGKDKSSAMVKVLFEPSEKMVASAKQKAPRKVVEY